MLKFIRFSATAQMRFRSLLFHSILAVLLLVAGSCGGKRDQQEDTTTAPADSTVTTILKDTILFKEGFPLITGPAGWENRYSKAFFSGYKSGSYTSIEVADNILILNQRDTAVFPETPVIGKKHHLRAWDKETEIQLTVIRKNYTTINYEITFSHPRKKQLKIQGEAHLHADFFLRSDQDQSTASGATFLVTEFEDLRIRTCPVRIRLGYEEMSGSALQAKIERKCNGKFGPVTPENFPSLMEQ